MLRFATASAASRTASASVGWAWEVRAMSSALAPNSIARTASAISSEAWGQDVEPEDPVAPAVGDYLDEAVPLAHGASPAVGCEEGSASRDLKALRPALLLGLAHAGQLGPRVNHVGDVS